MDGLLVDSEALYLEGIGAAAAERGLPFDNDLYLSLIGHPGPECLRKLAEHYGEGFPADEFWKASSEQVRRLACDKGVALKPGVLELFALLDTLALPRALCTSAQRHWVDHNLGPHGLLERFDALVVAGDSPRHKPHPDPYLEAARRLGVTPEFCLALEDSHNGVRSASSAGMMTVMAPDMLEATDEMRGLCVHIVDSLHRVRELLVQA